MAIFSIWESDFSGISLKQGSELPAFADGSLEDPNAICIKMFEASSWAEATQIRNDYYGWGPHKSWGESELEEL